MKLERAWMAVLMIGGLMAVLPAAVSASGSATAFVPAASADCPVPTVFGALTGFRDTRAYFIAPGGDFEAPRWDLTGGARLTTGSSPLGLGQAKTSLQLPPGSSATSPEFCVDLNYPTLRFFSAELVRKSDSKLNVDVIYPALAKNRKAVTVAPGPPGWVLSKDVALRPETVDKASGWRQVKIRFTAEPAATGDWRIDDVLVDPRMRG